MLYTILLNKKKNIYIYICIMNYEIRCNKAMLINHTPIICKFRPEKDDHILLKMLINLHQTSLNV